MRHAILVLGMHRSGTSALSGALVHLGVTPPYTLMPPSAENERGYFESSVFMAFHDTILAAANSRWNDWRRLSFPYASPLASGYRQRALQLLDEEFGDAPLFVLKDPRACRLVPFWLETLRHAAIEAHVIIPFRAPLEVAKSLATRGGISLEEGVALWLRHALDAERDSRGTRRSFIFMDDLLIDWRTSLDRVGRDLGVTWPKDVADVAWQLEAFLSPDLKHHASDSRSPVVEWAAKTFENFSRLSSDPGCLLAQASLDAIAVAFDQACELFGTFERSGTLTPPDPQGDSISNDNQPGAPDDIVEVASPRRQAHLWALQAQTAALRERLQSLHDQARAIAG